MFFPYLAVIFLHLLKFIIYVLEKLGSEKCVCVSLPVIKEVLALHI